MLTYAEIDELDGANDLDPEDDPATFLYGICLKGSDEDGYIVGTISSCYTLNEGPRVVYAERTEAVEQARVIYDRRNNPLYRSFLYEQIMRDAHELSYRIDPNNLTSQERANHSRRLKEEAEMLADVDKMHLLLTNARPC